MAGMNTDDRFQLVEKRLSIIEKWITNRINAQTDADEAMEEVSEHEHGPY